MQRLDRTVKESMQLICMLSEVARIGLATNVREQEDRKGVGLFAGTIDDRNTSSKGPSAQGAALVGLSEHRKGSVSLDMRCLSCSGQSAPQVLQLYKVACLNYNPSQVVYRNNEFSRTQVNSLTQHLLHKIEVRESNYRVRIS